MDKQFDSSRKIFTLSHLSVIAVTGKDSAKFLQGQLTCDINNLSESQASIAAFCTPKGRVISTLIIVKTAETFLLILPNSLLDKVLKRLQIYILRAEVALLDQSESLLLFGLHCLPAAFTGFNLPADDFAVGSHGAAFIKLPASSRYLGIVTQPESLTTLSAQNGFVVGDTEEWRYQDISSGFPWFDEEQSELYIPQMLHIDTLGGISFNKGCYTGQEIIARTHYLGKAKRSLFVAECRDILEPTVCGSTVLDADTQQSLGNILSYQSYLQNTRILVVLQSADAESKNLVLDDAKRTAIKIVAIN